MYSRVPLPYDKVIYVMEDVDAASHVVQRRAPSKAPAALPTPAATGVATAAAANGEPDAFPTAFTGAALLAAAGKAPGGAAGGNDDAASTKAHTGKDQAPAAQVSPANVH